MDILEYNGISLVKNQGHEILSFEMPWKNLKFKIFITEMTGTNHIELLMKVKQWRASPL